MIEICSGKLQAEGVSTCAYMRPVASSCSSNKAQVSGNRKYAPDTAQQHHKTPAQLRGQAASLSTIAWLSAKVSYMDCASMPGSRPHYAYNSEWTILDKNEVEYQKTNKCDLVRQRKASMAISNISPKCGKGNVNRSEGRLRSWKLN